MIFAAVNVAQPQSSTRVPRELGDQWFEFLVDLANLAGQLAATLGLDPRGRCDQPAEAGEPVGDRGRVFAAERLGLRRTRAGQNSDAVQRDLLMTRVRSATRSSRCPARRRTSRAGPSRRGGCGQVGLAQRCAGDGERVERDRLRSCGRCHNLSHHLRRHPNDALPGAEQVPFESP